MFGEKKKRAALDEKNTLQSVQHGGGIIPLRACVHAVAQAGVTRIERDEGILLNRCRLWIEL